MMKIILVVLTILSLATISFSQSTVDPEFTKDYYLAISKNQKTIAWALLGGGTAIAVTGMILGKQEDKPGDLGYDSNFDAGMWLFGGGIVADLVSIPFFISSSNNARRAASVSLYIKKVNYGEGYHQNVKTKPAICLSVAF
jgi:hypothetical protein